MGNTEASLRAESELHDPPPDYEPYADRVTVAVHSGGKIEHGVYIPTGGASNVVKHDNVYLTSLGLEAMKKFAYYLYGGKEFSLFVQVGNDLKLVKNDNIVKKACNSLGVVKELNVYVVDKISEYDEAWAEDEFDDDASLNLSDFSDSDSPYEYDMREDDDDGDIGYADFNVFERGVTECSKRKGKKKERLPDVVPDSCSEEDAEDVIDSGDDLNSNKGSDADDDQGRPTFPTFNSDHIFKPHFAVGMMFSTKQVLKLAIQSYAINERRSVKFPKNDKKRLYARCTTDDCPWILRGLWVDKGSSFRIRELVNRHTCRQRTNIENVSSTWLAKKYKDRFLNDPVRDINAFRVETVAELKVQVTRVQAYKAKRKAIKLIEGAPDKQYEQLWSFAEEIRRSNPGSTVVIETDGSDTRNRFDRMYVCLHASKEGFINGCRPVICLDGCWLKGINGGVLLTACGIDGNNSYLPIAYAVVGKENTETWTWFMRLIKQDLKIMDTSTYTLMSDKQKGLIQAEQDEFPGAEFRFCARHLYANFQQAGFKGQAFKTAFWKAALCATNNAFETTMDEIHKMDPKAEEWLRERPPSQWCRAFFREFPRCDLLTNNACETFNGNILQARKKPILPMFLDLHSYMMQRFVKNRDIAASSKRWKEMICPRIQKILDHHDKRITDYVPLKADGYIYQVGSIHNQNDIYSVNLQAGNCACRRWQLSGIPCIHAMAAISYIREDVEPYTHKCYYVESYKKTYRLPVLPINSMDEWPRTSMLPIIPPVRPTQRPGRPVTKRRLESGERPPTVRKTKRKAPILPGGEKIRRQQETVKCSKCGTPGHNARGCKEGGSNVAAGSSQVVCNNEQEEKLLQSENVSQDDELQIQCAQAKNKASKRKVGRPKAKEKVNTQTAQEGNEVLMCLPVSMLDLSGPIPSQFQESQSSINMVVPAPINPTKKYTSSVDLVGPVPEIIKDCHRFMTLGNIVKRADQLRELRKKRG